MSLAPIDNYDERTKKLLIGQFIGGKNFNKFVSSITPSFQELEDTFQDLLNERALDSAIGQQLDGIGTIVGLSRNGRDDETYREALQAKIFENVGSGEPNTLLNFLKTLTEAEIVEILEYYPATVVLYTNGLVIPNDLVSQVNKVRAAGVDSIPIVASLGEIPFIMDDVANLTPIPDTVGLGFSDVNELDEGGQFATSLQVGIKKGAALALENGDLLALENDDILKVIYGEVQ